MSNAKFKAVDDIRKIGRTLSGLIELANELEQVASLEQAAMDTKARVEKLRADEESAALKFAEAKAKADAQQSVADAIIEEAKDKAEQLLKQAQEKSAEIVGQAHTKAYETKTSSEVARAKALQDAKAVEAEIEVMKKEKSELEAVLGGLKSELDALKKRIG